MLYISIKKKKITANLCDYHLTNTSITQHSTIHRPRIPLQSILHKYTHIHVYRKMINSLGKKNKKDISLRFCYFSLLLLLLWLLLLLNRCPDVHLFDTIPYLPQILHNLVHGHSCTQQVNISCNTTKPSYFILFIYFI